MTNFLHRFQDATQPYLGRLFPWIKRSRKSSVSQIYTQRSAAISPERQQALRSLCEQLFKKRELLTSGKLQLIGLENIRKRMGKRWDGLCAVVYETVDDVIRQHIGENDLFIRYTDETYVIIFARTNLEEGEATAALIAEEIRRRLFLLDEEALKEIEVKNSVRQTRTDSLSGFDFSDFLGAFVDDSSTPVINLVFDEPQDDESLNIRRVEIDAEDYRPEAKKQNLVSSTVPLNFSYMPLWDVKRGALTTYLCLAARQDSPLKFLDAHKAIYKGFDIQERTAIDIQMLSFVKEELTMMAEEQRKLLVVCPVSYETLFGFEGYEIYKEHLYSIPTEHRQFLVLLILKPDKILNAKKDAYWFIPPLKGQCRLFFTEVPLKQGINFQSLKAMGIDGVGLSLDKGITEQQAMSVLSNFSASAKTHKISLTFILGVSSLSLTTSSVCAGFDYVGGVAIHDAVPKPDTIHKYQHEEIILELIKK